MFDLINGDRIACDAEVSTADSPNAPLSDTAAQKYRLAPMYAFRMTEGSIKDVLWANIVALMERQWGGENQRRLAREAGIAPGGSTRLKNPDVDVRLSMLVRVARTFGVEPWQLIEPKLGENLYVIDEERRLAPVYSAAANVVKLPEPPSRGGLRMKDAQKARYAQKTRAPQKRTG